MGLGGDQRADELERDGYAAFVMPRSGLAARNGITVVNAPGTVDAGYRGEIRVTVVPVEGGAATHLAGVREHLVSLSGQRQRAH